MKNTITEKEYDLLAQACDQLLNAKAHEFSRIANSSLHLIREHPIFLQQYLPLFTKSTVFFYFFLLAKLLKYLSYGSLKLLHSLYITIFKGDRLVIPNNSFDHLFISHFLNKNFLVHKDDFYFHELPHKLQKNNKKSLVAYINYTAEVNPKWKHNEVEKITLPRYLSFFGELKIRQALFKDTITLLFGCVEGSLLKKVKLNAAVEALSPASYFNLRLGVQMGQLVQRVSPKKISTTFEGHPWERIAFAYARNVNPNIQCVGYQHALIFRKQHAIRRKLADQFEPDFILFSGPHARNQFTASHYLPKERLLLFGSNRTSGAKRENLAVNAEKKDTFLMLSEGDLIECIPLVQLVLKLANKYSQLNFIIRFHPITKVEQVLKICPALNQPPSNITLSEQSFEADLERAHFALYRGSTTIIKAVQYGLIPVYFERKNEISIDPLFEMQAKKVNIDESGALEKLLQLNADTLKENQQELIQHVDQFFSPIDYTVVEQLKSTP